MRQCTTTFNAAYIASSTYIWLRTHARRSWVDESRE
jgi:hypothetical protein